MTATRAPVSVIIPCFRCADTIERAVRSVLAQTWPVAEIILVEDGSGDGTLDTLRALRGRLADPRLRVLALPDNGGPGVARNAGWEQATQPWLAFLDADDAWHPRKIELQLGWLQSNPEVVLCAHETTLWRENLPALSETIGDARVITFRALLFRDSIPTRSVLMRRDVPLRFGDANVAEDLLLWLDITSRSYPSRLLPVALAYSFRPEFSAGGFSGAIWEHEKRELECFTRCYRRKSIGIFLYAAASAFSILKFLRRVLAVSGRRMARRP